MPIYQHWDIFLVGDSGAIRTLDPRLRRALLYPAELRNHPAFKTGAKVGIIFVSAKHKFYFPTKFPFCVVPAMPDMPRVQRLYTLHP